MLDKFIESSQLCFELGHPTPLGYFALLSLALIAFVLITYWRAK